MSIKTASAISGLSTFFILILVAVLSVFGQKHLLNGASEAQGFNAISISLICQSVGLLLAVILARWLTNLFITKYDWNKILAMLVSVFAGVTLGGGLSFAAFFISIFLQKGCVTSARTTIQTTRPCSPSTRTGHIQNSLCAGLEICQLTGSQKLIHGQG